MNGNKIIDLLYLCEDSKKIQDLEKELQAPRPTINRDFKEDGYTVVSSKATNTEIAFSDIRNFNQNISNDLNCNMIFSGMIFSSKSKIPLPFSLKLNDSLETVRKKINKKEDYTNKNFPTKIWHLERNDGKDYFVYVDFNDDYTQLNSVTIQTYDDTIDDLDSEFVEKEN